MFGPDVIKVKRREEFERFFSHSPDELSKIRILIARIKSLSKAVGLI
jgi:hypothetical protein